MASLQKHNFSEWEISWLPHPTGFLNGCTAQVRIQRRGKWCLSKSSNKQRSVKVEGLSQAALIKSLSPRVLLSNHLLPKGTKMKVNLEDQSRQKVSFSFSQTKKPLQSLLFISSSPEKSGAEPSPATAQSSSGKGHSADTKSEQKSPSIVLNSRTRATSQTTVSPTKLKTDLSKLHFKKHILNVSVTDEQPSSVVDEPHNERQTFETVNTEAHNVASSRITAILQTLAASSGKDGVYSSRSESDNKGHKSTNRTYSDCAPPGFESDGDSGQSSTRKSSDSKSQSSSNGRRKEERKHSSSSHSEEKDKSSSKRSDTYETSSSYSKSERDSRHTLSRSSRSDRRRSRSRSRSRGSRTSSSHSRLDRSRGDRGSRSERSHYHDSDRRSYRTSPRRDRRRSRSRTDKNQDSSDSEDDRRKARTRTCDSSRSTAYSSSHKESRSSYMKSTSKSTDEFEKTSSSKQERFSKRLLESDAQHRGSSVTDHHRSSHSHKSDNNSKSSSSSSNTRSHSSEKYHKSIGDLEREKFHTSDKRPRSDEQSKSSHKTSKAEPKQAVSSVSEKGDSHRTYGRQSDDSFHSMQNIFSTTESCLESKEKMEHSSDDINEMKDLTQADLENKMETCLKLVASEHLNEINDVLEANDGSSFAESNDQTVTSKAISISCEGNNVKCNVNPLVECSQELLLKSCEVIVPQDLNNSVKSDQFESEALFNPDFLPTDSEIHWTCKEPCDGAKKSNSASRKSRWDIVGQNTLEHSNTTDSPEMKLDVKTAFNMNTINVSKESIQQGTDANEHVVRHSTTKENELDKTPRSESRKDQSVSSEVNTKLLEPLQNREPATNKCQISNDENATRPSSKSKRALLNLQVGHIEASDSDNNSEYDSDCGEAIKQLHSVVALAPPSESPLTGEDPLDRTSAEQWNDIVASETQARGTFEDPANITLCQSQSNMIDSTSHSESSQLYLTAHMTVSEGSNFMAQQGQQYDVNSGNAMAFLHYKQEQFSRANTLTDINGYNPLWNYTQAEQPSSTCPQLDSSHGPQATDNRLTETISHLQMQNNVPSDLTPATQIRQDSSEIHPDSLTNDHGVYSGGKSCETILCQGVSSFVQGHEISSNSRGSATTEPTKEESLKHLRSRGPPKKRRPELESDSDNEAEAGPTGRKERRLDTVKDVSVKTGVQLPVLTLRDFHDASKWKESAKFKKMPPYFDLIEENLYLTERKKSKSHRDIKRMQCECTMLSREERSKGVMACGEDCLNRLLMIECSSRCLNGAYCSNRRFQMKQHADFEVILTEDKGWGLRAAKDMPANTFVLEYCGEVLDHKEFKARVKEYARMKNIHYYFMSLKNNEIIDATLKGNCSRFMNHSCEPNCETQKWTVNGQLRVGFFTTKAVTAGTELTFDYQFQRYGKEAQKCYCGAPSCRGFLGGENRVSVRAAGGKMKKDRNRKNALTTVDEELEALLDNGEGLYDEKQVVALCRLMVRVETMEQKLLCLKLIQDTQNPSCLKQFLDHHGLSLLWIFMVELSEAKGNSTNNIKLQLEILKTLAVLPISTKNMLEESKVLTLIQRWAQSCPQATENDGYSSENTSRAQTPLNTPDGSNTRVGTDMDSDTSKPSVFRRLKIISENSLDSALSDASKASDGKEDDEDDDEDDDESSRVGLSEIPEAKPEQEVVTKTELVDIKAETEVEPEEIHNEIENKIPEDGGEELDEKKMNIHEEPKSTNDQDGTEMILEMVEHVVKGDISDSVMEITDEKEPNKVEYINELEVITEETAVTQQDDNKVDDSQDQSPEEEASTSTGPAQTETVHPVPSQTEPALTASISEPMEVQAEVQISDKTSPEQPNECAVDVALSSDAAEVSVTSAAASVEPSVVGTPSQDDEDALSDVESERSQEPQLSSLDISGMAARLLETWKDLKEVYRIPKKNTQKEVEKEDRIRDRDTARPASGSREREREKERDRERDYDRDRERDRDRTPRSSERRRRRSLSPPSSYERSSRRTEERFDNVNSKTPRSVGGKERNKLSTEERRKLFEQEVAQREAQKQQQQLQQQHLQTLAYDPALAYASSSAFITYPPGYPLQGFLDPTNPNAGKVLLPTPPVDTGMTYEQTPPLGLSSPSSTSQATPVASIPQQLNTIDLTPGASQYTQPPPNQDTGVAVLSVPPPAAPQVQGQSYTTLWDPSTQQTVTVQTAAQQYTTAPAQPQAQAAIYYQGQPCQTIYSIPTAYPQGSTPVIQAYTDPAGNYLHSQPVYPGQQGVVVQQGGTVTTIVTSQTQEVIVPNNVIDLPPPSPPKPKTIVLPPNWKVARDPEGKIYYYHIVTRQTQWDPPTWDGTTESTTVDHESEMDLGTPTYDENPSKFSTKTAEADTSSELAKKSKETFRKDMSQFIVQCLNPYRKPDCKLGRIVNTEDFKHLARKLTHGVMNKELKACKNPEDLECNENVKHKTKEYIKKYMQRFGSVYRPKEDTEVY